MNKKELKKITFKAGIYKNKPKIKREDIFFLIELCVDLICNKPDELKYPEYNFVNYKDLYDTFRCDLLIIDNNFYIDAEKHGLVILERDAYITKMAWRNKKINDILK